MTNPLDSEVHEDVRTFSMYQRLRKSNPYAYYCLNTQKQMQADLRNFGSPAFFEQNPDDLQEFDEPTDLITLPKALLEAEHCIDSGSSEFNEKTETILSILYATDTVPIRRSALHGDNHKLFAAMIVLLHEQSLQLEVDEYNTSELRTFGHSMTFMQFLAKAEARYVMDVMVRTEHKAFYCVSAGAVGTLDNGYH